MMDKTTILGGTDFGKGGPILAAKIGPAGPILVWYGHARLIKPAWTIKNWSILPEFLIYLLQN